MAATAKAAKKGAWRIGKRTGFTKATFSIEREQLAALVAEARKRADAAGVIRADASEVVREALAAWMKARR